MIDAAQAIIEIIGDLDIEELRTDSLRRAAVLWNYTVLGEAAARLPTDFKSTHPQIRWAQSTRVRNRIVHGYFDLTVGIPYRAAEVDLPPLIAELATVITLLERES